MSHIHPKTFWMIPKTFEKNIMWAKCNIFSVFCYIKHKAYTQFEKKNCILGVKHGLVMDRSCFISSGPGRLATVDGTIKCGPFQIIMKETSWASVCGLKL